MHDRRGSETSSRIPIVMKKKVIGAVAIFQDRTEAAKMAEELTGVRNFVEALRVQNHEHMNKLHTIAGLIQLGKSEKALQLAFQASTEQENVTEFLHRSIQNDAAAGLLLSKIRRGRELGIAVHIDENSSLQQFPEHVDQHDIVDPVDAGVHGLIGSMSKEYPNWQTKLIDVKKYEDLPLSQLLSLLADQEGNTWAYRDKV